MSYLDRAGINIFFLMCERKAPQSKAYNTHDDENDSNYGCWFHDPPSVRSVVLVCPAAKTGVGNAASMPEPHATPASMTTGSLFDISDGFFAHILRIARCIVRGAFDLIGFPCSFELFVAADVAGDLFYLAGESICCTFCVFVIHKSPLVSSDAIFRNGGGRWSKLSPICPVGSQHD
jgi:hypothetical protein